jgi:hypothetical protein
LAIAGVVRIGLTVTGLLLRLTVTGLLLRLAVTGLLRWRLAIPRLLRLAVTGLLSGRSVSLRVLLLRLLGLRIRTTASHHESGSCEDEGCVREDRSFHGGSSGKGAKCRSAPILAANAISRPLVVPRK